MTKEHFDYIIAGAGLAGLSLAWHIIHSPLHRKKVLVVDADLNPPDNKTWCFWHKEVPPFSEVILKTWKQVEVHVQAKVIQKQLKTYSYHCINSSDFTSLTMKRLKNHPSVQLKEGRIEFMGGNKNEATITVDGTTFTADYIFQSCLIPPSIKNSNSRFPLRQHFLGWDLESKQDLFDPDTVTLMDFDESFEDGVAFIYILPWTSRRALIEYTIFSPAVNKLSFYENKLELYLFNRFGHKRLNYQVNRTEFGEIPMQDLPYAPWYAPRVINMGTVGGLTKPSTGYTFTRIQNHVQAIVRQLTLDNTPAPPSRSAFRFRAYDLWLLQILYDHPREALNVFHNLFANNSFDSVFRFLEEGSTLRQDLKIMSSVPYYPFLRAIWDTKKRLFEL